MAERRMFTKKITDSDAFISLPSSSQALYFHLCQAADDDGFNNQVKMAMMKAHASEDDLKVLLAKNFIISFESGVIVIKHWRMHNALRKDRHIPTNYQEELATLGIKDNGSYTLDNTVAKWLPNGCQTVAVGQVRLGKDSIGEDSLGKFSIGQSIEDGLTDDEKEILKGLLKEHYDIFIFYIDRRIKKMPVHPYNYCLKVLENEWSEQ